MKKIKLTTLTDMPANSVQSSALNFLTVKRMPLQDNWKTFYLATSSKTSRKLNELTFKSIGAIHLWIILQREIFTENLWSPEHINVAGVQTDTKRRNKNQATVLNWPRNLCSLGEIVHIADWDQHYQKSDFINLKIFILI